MKEEWKAYIRGNKDRGKEVIKALTDLGGKTDFLNGSNRDSIYFINHDSAIDFVFLVSEIAKIIMDNYTELCLPEKWKDGDILVDKHDSQIMVLYEFVSENEADLFNAHIRLHGNLIVLHSLEVRKRFRLATDEEIERFYEILHEQHKDWDAEKKQLVEWRWKPSLGDEFWIINCDGSVLSIDWDDSPDDKETFAFGNCFQTEEEAKAAAERVKKALKGE